jgi:hypothetical protein
MNRCPLDPSVVYVETSSFILEKKKNLLSGEQKKEFIAFL